MENNNFRGKCESETKVTKSGRPKRSGNFSYSTFHRQNLQSKDYYVAVLNDGRVIVGDHTPIQNIFNEDICNQIINNPLFYQYIEKGIKTVRGKQYDAQRSITRREQATRYGYTFEFVYREQIYTDGDFTFNFPDY